MGERIRTVAKGLAIVVLMAGLMGAASLMSLTEQISFIGTAHANDITVSNTAVVEDSESGVRVVSFDLSWENSWRSADLDGSDDFNAGNWDAAWVFVKYRTAGGVWKHARLTATGHGVGTATGENMGEGAALQVGLVDQGAAYDASGNPGMGAMIYRGEAGAGTFAADSLTLRWNYAADGLSGSEEYFVEVYAVEMVYVSPGAFYAGSSSDGTEDARFVTGAAAGSDPFLVTSSWDGCVSDTEGCLWADGSMDAGGTFASGFPTGFSGFYGMKYEVSQQQYVDFLNSLPAAQAQARAYVDGADRSGISYVAPADGVAGYYTTSTPYVANNYMNWIDAATYLDWAGLRPMTELEYEKASRGYAEPVADGYAWGSATITSTGDASNYSNLGGASESVSQGNAVYDGSNPGGPARVGIFAGTATSREAAGAGYWGMMELSGNVGEMVVTVGNEAGRGFTGLHGDGVLSANGAAMVASWPGLTEATPSATTSTAATPSVAPGQDEGEVTGAYGSGLRGGSLADAEAVLATAARTSAATGVTTRANNTGLRGARTMPAGSIFALTVQVSGDGTPNVGGTVSPSSGSYATGTQVELTATSEEGWLFSTWSGDVPDGAIATDSVLTITMDSNKSLTAEFEEEDTGPQVVASTTGAEWLDRNLGASQVATSSNDADAYGDLYQWGRAADGHEKRTSSTTSTLSSTDQPGHGDFITVSSSPHDWRSPQNDNLWQGVNGVNNPCPAGFRLPTSAEWDAERASWSSNNSAGAYASPLKLPMAGFRSGIGSLSSVGSLGYYWSSSVDGTNASYLYFFSSTAGMGSQARAYGFSVRCIKEFGVVNSTTGAVWMDRNLGASQVATSSTDADAYGDLYQWGRAADGHQKIDSQTTTTLSDTDTPGNGEFILKSNAPYDWRSSQNDNLWQGVDGVNNPCPAGFRLPTDAEWDAERLSWGSNNSEGAFGSLLALPTPGYRSGGSGSILVANSQGRYWSSSVDGTNAKGLIITSSSASVSGGLYRSTGLSVRCIKHVVPTVTSSTGAVWMDRNLGASKVATSSADADAYGDLYQWGRATDGHEKRTSLNRSTLSDTDTPGHGDFITSANLEPYDWRSSQNDNLWQGVDGVNNPCPAGFRLPTQVEWEAERTSWDSDNSAGAFGSPLKLTNAGMRNIIGSSLTVGTVGQYWSSSVDGVDVKILRFNSSTSSSTLKRSRGNGNTVRCIKD